MKVAVLVLYDLQIGAVARNIEDADIAAIEGAGDRESRLTVIVRPDTPGKSLNKAPASLAAAMPGCAAGAFSFASVIARPSQMTVASARRLIWTLSSVIRSEEHTSELQSLMRISYAVFCLKKKTESQHVPTIFYRADITNQQIMRAT